MSNTDTVQIWSSIIQAFSSVVAIIVAIWIPLRMDRKARQRQAEIDVRKEQNVQISLLPTLYDLRFKISDYIEQEKGEHFDIYGEPREIEPEYFDSDFLSVLPDFITIVDKNLFTHELQNNLNQLSALLFVMQDSFKQNYKLQRKGYHAAWINHKDDFIEKAQKIFDLTNQVIKFIEEKNKINRFYTDV